MNILEAIATRIAEWGADLEIQSPSTVRYVASVVQRGQNPRIRQLDVDSEKGAPRYTVASLAACLFQC